MESVNYAPCPVCGFQSVKLRGDGRLKPHRRPAEVFVRSAGFCPPGRSASRP